MNDNSKINTLYSKGGENTMYKSIITIMLVMILISASASFATLQSAWRMDVGAAGSVVWNDSNNRGMCYNPATDTILIARTTPNIFILDAASGASTGFVNVTGVSGGSVALVKVRTTTDGVIYANALTTNDTTATLTIYRWANEGATVTTTYRNRAAGAPTAEPSPVGPTMPAHAVNVVYRIGDGMGVVMSGSTVDFYLGVSTTAGGANLVYKFRSIDGGLSIDTIIPISLTSGSGSAYRGTAVDGFDGNIYHFSNGVMAQWTNDGVTRTVFPNSIYNDQLGSSFPELGTIAGRKFIGYVDAISAGGGGFRRGSVADMTNGPALAGVVDFTDQLATPNTNTNGTGDFAIDTIRNRFIFLITNNFLGSYNYSAGVTKYWDNGGSDGNWANDTNWSPDGIPTGFDNVVLDNSIVSGAYTVLINDPVKSCRTLTIGDAVSANAITLDITGGSVIQLNIAGTQSINTSILIRNGGRWQNRSSAASGNVIMNRNGGNIFQLLNGGYAMHSTARSFSTPFPATGDGAIVFDSGATMDFWLGTASVTMSGRTYPNLVLNSNSGAAVTMSASGGSPAVIQNDLTIGPFVTFNPSMVGIFEIQGNIINNGVAATLSCTTTQGLALNGTSGQSISGTGTVTFAGTGVTLDNAAGLTLNRNVSINSTLFMKSGNIATGSNYLTLGVSGDAGILNRTTGTIIGNLIRGVPAATGSYIYPLGTGATYNEASVTFTVAPTAGVITAAFIAADPGDVGLPLADGAPTPIFNVQSFGYWKISGPVGGTYNLALQANGFTTVSGSSTLRVVTRADGASTWGLAGTNVNNIGLALFRNGLTGFSEFGVGEDATPVTLSRFEVE
jgi:hypothetical protein